jgi:Na+:H+ antiporter, NhaC family
MPSVSKKPVTFLRALFPVAALITIILYGLILRPMVQGLPAFPLEIVFLSAAVVAIAQLAWLGFSWEEIQKSIINKLAKAFPTIMILFAIGMIIGSWIAAGTIPMLVYYGIKIIHPDYLYLIAFVVAGIFSTLTGTSWGSAGTIGLVLMGVAITVDANLPITAGAVIGGAFFGDKMSPLSDTTNVAALAVDVPLFDHIQSMMYTTVPSALMAGVLYLILGFVYPVEATAHAVTQTEVILSGIKMMFNFNIILLLPVLIVLYGSIKRMATLPVLVSSSFAAIILAILFQQTTLGDAVQSLYKGYDTSMATWMTVVPPDLEKLFNRGGLYELSEPVIISIIVFVYVGSIDKINAMPIIVERVFSFAKTRSSIILSSLASTTLINSITSNQMAASFIVGEAFHLAYFKKGIPKKVLSRSLEDAGTMIEPMVPWHTTAIFMGATLGVPVSQYWQWQFLSLINIVVAVFLALTGIGCFYNKQSSTETEKAVEEA